MAHPSSVVHDASGGEVGDAPGTRSAAPAERAAHDAGWLLRIRQGDTEAFGELFSQYFLPLTRTARQYVRTAEAAQDTVSEVFLWLWRKREAVEIRGELRAYLHMAVRHRALNARVRRRVERNWQGAFAAEGSSPAFSQRLPLADEALEREELAAECAAALARLPARAQEVMRMRYLEGMKREQIAARLGMSLALVKADLYVGARTLREHWRGTRCELR